MPSSAKSTPSDPRLTSAEFRDVIGHFATGVTVITTSHEGESFGTTASAVSSVSLEPPMVLICMNETSVTGRAIAGSGLFAINILGEHQRALAEHFASKHPGKFESADVTTGVLGQPLLADAVAHLECRVTDQVTGGTHSVFLAAVESAAAPGGEPLAYFRGQFGRLEMAHDHATYTALRKRLLEGEIASGQPVDLATLAEELDAEPGALYQALGRLANEGVVERVAAGEFHPRAITWELVHDALDSRCAIELGVVEMTIGRVNGEELAELRRATDGWDPTAGQPTAAETRASIARSTAFHDALVRLARRDGLLAAYQSIAVPAVMALAGAAHAQLASVKALENDHRELLDAYERGDAAGAREIILRHNELLKQAARQAIDDA